MYETRYNLVLSPQEGNTQVQIEVISDSGDIRLTLSSPESSQNKYKQIITLTSDMDAQSLIEALQWARYKSLKLQGFKVIK